MVFRSAVGVIGAPYKLFAVSQVCQPFQSPGFIAVVKVLNLRTHRLSGAAGKRSCRRCNPELNVVEKTALLSCCFLLSFCPCYPVWMVEREPVLFPLQVAPNFRGDGRQFYTWPRSASKSWLWRQGGTRVSSECLSLTLKSLVLGECWSRGVLCGVCAKMRRASRVLVSFLHLVLNFNFSMFRSSPHPDFTILPLPVISSLITLWFGLVVSFGACGILLDGPPNWWWFFQLEAGGQRAGLDHLGASPTLGSNSDCDPVMGQKTVAHSEIFRNQCHDNWLQM